MEGKHLSRLVSVDLREAWQHEATDFTNWLAKEDNLELLAETLGISISSPETEVNVGSFSVDIRAEDDSDHVIVIENQLEKTDHDHLGKLITYASGLDAKTMIWIVKESREEHRQAVQWLNSNTSRGINFFLIEVEVLKIDDSAPAPRFNIIERPNEWAKEAKQQTGTGKEKSALALQQLAFFNDLRDYGRAHAQNVKSWQNGSAQHWYTTRIGTSEAHIDTRVNSRDKRIAVDIYIDDNMELFQSLFADKDEIETALGSSLQWYELPGKKASTITIEKDGDFLDDRQRDELIQWAVGWIDRFTRVFGSRIKKILRR